MKALQGTVDTIQATWKGSGSNSFGNWVQSFDKSSRQISDSLTTASNALTKAANALQKAHGNVTLILQQVSADATQLKADIAELQAAKKDVTALEAQLASLAKNATPQVKAEIDQAEQELGNVITDLQDAIDLAQGNFLAIKVPGGAPVKPTMPGGTTTILTSANTPPGGGSPTPAGGSSGSAGGSSGSAGGSSGGGPIAADTGAHSTSAAANQAIAESLITKDFPQWNNSTQLADLKALWNRESGWSNTAQNPGSGAFGIAQSLPPTKMPLAAQPTSLGGSADATAQIQWGLQYILGRYGSPAAAWAHEVSMGWY
jgi:WXG100 family type VII secretion target